MESQPLVEGGSAGASDASGSSPGEQGASVLQGFLVSTGFTVAAAIIVALQRGSEGAMLFLASYLMELSLSVDNMFAFYLIFKFYKCPLASQGPCLFWGILGAILLRAVMLVIGVTFASAAKPLMLVFAAVLIYSSFQMFWSAGDDEDDDLSSNRVVLCVRRLRMPVSKDYAGSLLFVKEGGQWKATPLFLVLATIEFSDIVFAVDSVPAVLGLSNDTLIVYLAVMCAVLGLRSVYTVTVVLVKSFHYLQHAVALLLLLIGLKISADVLLGLTVPPAVCLPIIGGVLAAGVLASLGCAPSSGPGTHARDSSSAGGL